MIVRAFIGVCIAFISLLYIFPNVMVGLDYSESNTGIVALDDFVDEMNAERKSAYVDESEIDYVTVDLGVFTGQETVVPNTIESIFGEGRKHYLTTTKGQFEIDRKLEGAFRDGLVMATKLGDNRLSPEVCVVDSCARLLTEITTDNEGKKIVVNENKFVKTQDLTLKIVLYTIAFLMCFAAIYFVCTGRLA